MSRVVFREPKRVGETRTFPCDFSSYISAGVVITAQTCTISLYSGVDANPSAMLSGAASHVGTIVNQNLIGGIVGNLYSLLYTATLSDGQAPEFSGFVYVEPDIP